MVTSVLYKKLRQRESKRFSKRKESEPRETLQLVDPSFEFVDGRQLVTRQRPVHDEHPDEEWSPDCALCNAEHGLVIKVPSRSLSLHSTFSFESPDQAYSPSEYNSSSDQSGSPTSQTSAMSLRESLVSTPLFAYSNSRAAQTHDGTIPIGSANLPSPASIDEEDHQHQLPPQELEAPPSYEVATSPRSSFAVRPRLEPRLDSPFSAFDPLESLPELPSDCLFMRDSRWSFSDSSNSPLTPMGGASFYSAGVGTVQMAPRMSISLTPIPERITEHEDGLGYRDDLIKRGLIL